nr:hypothetical protein B0A51_02269 [Rachicladosporium sp. CCFEE 5018]
MSDDEVPGSPTPPPTKTTIGLSFGNTNSSIAYTGPDGKAEVIANEEGDRQIPSILSYVSGEEYTGTQAKAQIVRNPTNTVAFFRDFLGKGFGNVDPTACHRSAHPKKLGEDGVGFVVKEGEGEEETEISVEEVAVRHIKRLRQSATDYLGREVGSAVLTVPSDFTEEQKSAVSKAASKAGLEIIQTIHEPVAALLAHDARLLQSGEGDESKHDKIVLVADLGGIRSDIAVIASRGGIYTTLATAHDYELGGSTLDKVLIEYAAKEFFKKNKSAGDPRENARSVAKLTLEAEAVRKALSIGQNASFSIESLIDGRDFTLAVPRTRYELLANKVFASFTRFIEAAVQKAELDILDIDTILLTGGTSHTPKIAANLQSHFPSTTTIIAPSTSATATNPSELAVRGAAIQASLISEFEKEDIESSTEAVVTVTPHTHHPIGIVLGNDSFAVIVPADTPVPARRTAQIAVPAGGDVLIRLAEGVREIKVTKPEKAATNGTKDADDSDEDSDEEDEEVRERVFKSKKVLAEAGIKGVKKGGKVEVQVNVQADLSVSLVCREVGGKGGVRGTIEKAQGMNGSAK